MPGVLPVLPLQEMVPFPDTLTPLAVGRERSMRLVNEVLSGERMLAMVASKNPEAEEPGPDELYDVGVAGVVARMLKVPDGTIRILVQGTERVRLTDYVAEEPYLIARIEPMPDVVEPSAELEALTHNVQRTFAEIIEQIPYLPEELQLAVANLDDPSALAHLIAGALRISTEEKQELLEQVDVGKRLRRLSEILARELEVVQLGTKIQSQVQSEIDKGQREFYLREQLKAIQQELGEGDEQQAEINELRERIEGAKLPEAARKQADRELGRLERLPPAAAEHGVIRTYLEWLVELPWANETEDNLDLAHAREVLDADHYDLERVKDRILEYLAVRRLNPNSPGPILCFVGPPGVGKTSLGRSIAKALGREFERISVGGVRDEAEIRGHRRTYIGALPGRDHPRAARRGNPQPSVHDRRDRQDGRGLPGRSGERDARGAGPRPEPVVPRSLPGPRIRPLGRDVHRDREHAGHRPDPPPGPHGGDPARRLHGGREAPHREALPRAAPDRSERPVARPDLVLRRRDSRPSSTSTPARPAFATSSGRSGASAARSPGRSPRGRRRARSRSPPSARGSCWASAGSSPSSAGAPGSREWPPGSPGRRSAARSCSWRRARCRGTASSPSPARSARSCASPRRPPSRGCAGTWSKLPTEVPEDWFAAHDIHVHVPAGAVPKDGPSAGVAMAVALVSLVTGKPVSSDVAMTGEVTLTGQVLPIGGLKEKALAAQRAGIKRVLVPARNEGDVDEIPEHQREGLEFIYCETIEDALVAAF